MSGNSNVVIKLKNSDVINITTYLVDQRIQCIENVRLEEIIENVEISGNPKVKEKRLNVLVETMAKVNLVTKFRSNGFDYVSLTNGGIKAYEAYIQEGQ